VYKTRAKDQRRRGHHGRRRCCYSALPASGQAHEEERDATVRGHRRYSALPVSEQAHEEERDATVRGHRRCLCCCHCTLLPLEHAHIRVLAGHDPSYPPFGATEGAFDCGIGATAAVIVGLSIVGHSGSGPPSGATEGAYSHGTGATAAVEVGLAIFALA
jgi:hypothetical protein